MDRTSDQVVGLGLRRSGGHSFLGGLIACCIGIDGGSPGKGGLAPVVMRGQSVECVDQGEERVQDGDALVSVTKTAFK